MGIDKRQISAFEEFLWKEEKRLIDEKMKQLPIKQYGAYLRKMAIDGYILVIDRSDT